MEESNKFIKFIRHPISQVIAFVIPIIMLIYGTWNFFFPKNTIIQRGNNTTVLALDGTPEFSELYIYPTVEYTSVPIITFKFKDAIPKKSVVFLDYSEDSTINWVSIPFTIEETDSFLKRIDSILRLTEYSLTDLSYFCNLNLRLKNTGATALQVIYIFFRAGVDLPRYILREPYYNPSSQKYVINSNLDEHKTLFKDSVITYSIPRFPLLWPLDSITRKSTLHILILYRDMENNYYDSYYWATYKFKFPNFKVVGSWLDYEWDFSEVVNFRPYIATTPKLTTNDFLQFEKSNDEYGQPLNDSEKENIISYLSSKQY